MKTSATESAPAEKPEGETIAEAKKEEAASHQITLAENALVLSLTTGQDATRLIEQRMHNLERLRRAAFALTSASDWVMFRDKEGNVFAMLAGDSRERVADMLGISTSMARPVDDLGNFAPAHVEGPNGIRGIRAWADGQCALLGRSLPNLEATIWEGEDFTGRSDGRDQRASLMTRLRAKAVRIFAGASRVSDLYLNEVFGSDAWQMKARKGSGYGDAAERAAAGVSEAGMEEARAALRNEILRFANGDEKVAKAVLKRITAYPAYKNKEGKDVRAFAGMESAARFTAEWQVKKAWEKLRADPDYKAWSPAPEDRGEMGEEQGSLT